MFATRLYRQTAKVSALLLVVALLANRPAAQAATPSNGGWQPKDSGGAAQSSAASQVVNPWKLPNGQTVPAESKTKNGAPSNQSRQTQSAATPPREPRVLPTPSNAKPLTSAQYLDQSKRSSNVQKHSGSAAVTQTAAVVPASRPANGMSRPMMQQQPNIPRIARAMPPSRSVSNPGSPRMWQRMNVAMNGAEWTGESEDLPLPSAGPTNKSTHTMDTSDPFNSDPDGYYLNGDAQGCQNCGPGGCECGGDCCCGEGCGGGVCEPGCGCGCGGQCGSACSDPCANDCLSIGPGDAESCHSVRMRVPKWQELAIFAGVQGFKGPYDQERDGGNFGFHEGFNAGFKIPYTFAGYQIGYEAAQSQLNGDENTGFADSHTQHFTTFGLFRRTKDGLQFGTAWDTLVDRRWEARTFHQLRNEISWMDSCSHEFGASATVGIMDHEDPDDSTITWEARDQYVLFYRFHGKNGGEGRFYGGWSDDSDGIIGADMLIPVHDRWSVQSGFTYMMPDARDGIDGASEEAWNLNLAMVWHWGCTARTSHDNPYRPLFNVANNGYMIIDSRENN
jgi:hypothetical protein